MAPRTVFRLLPRSVSSGAEHPPRRQTTAKSANVIDSDFLPLD
jgi:hypothetical protein